MARIFANPTVEILLLLFYWVPFALAAYLSEVWDPQRTRRSFRRWVDQARHAMAERPTASVSP